MSDPTSTPAPELKTYHGNCHCGAFKFHILVPEIKEVTECGCSICFKKGYKWVFPGEGGFIIDKGDATTLTEYHFGQQVMAHQFCSTCGTAVAGKRHIEKLGLPASMEYGVNARALHTFDQEADIWALKTIHSDTLSRSPLYTPPPFTGNLPVPSPSKIKNFHDPKTYTGSCHCGLITLALISNGPLPSGREYIQECNCSICVRNGTTLIYPHQSQVSITNVEKLVKYAFGREWQSHDFCPTCGVAVLINKFDLEVGEGGKWTGSREKYVGWRETVPVNLRLFEGVEWPGSVVGERVVEGEVVEVKKGSWKTYGEAYKVPE